MYIISIDNEDEYFALSRQFQIDNFKSFPSSINDSSDHIKNSLTLNYIRYWTKLIVIISYIYNIWRNDNFYLLKYLWLWNHNKMKYINSFRKRIVVSLYWILLISIQKKNEDLCSIAFNLPLESQDERQNETEYWMKIWFKFDS